MNEASSFFYIIRAKIPLYEIDVDHVLTLQGMDTSSALGRAVNSLLFLEFAAAL
jgi:hypothetical protein